MKSQFLSVTLAALSLSFCCMPIAPVPAIAEDQEKLIFAVDVIRHGDRSPIEDFPSAPHKWPRGLGQLTAEGMHQEFELGKEFRTRYIEQNQLLPAQYDVETVHVRASDIDRCLVSAECNLLGLYPLGQGPLTDDGKEGAPSRYQPIPIHTRPKELEDCLIPDSIPGLHETYQQYVYDSKEWKDKEAEQKPNFERWGKAIGKPIPNLQALSGIGDTVHIRQIHKVAPPAGLTEADQKAMMEISDWVFAETFKPAQVGEKAGMPLLNLIEKNLDETINGKSTKKWILYSCHDSTICSLMSAMKAPYQHRPHYASDLNISLFKKGSDYIVKAKLNGEEVNFPGSTHGVSSLKTFQELPIVKAQG